MPTPEVHSDLGASSIVGWSGCAQYLNMQKLFPETPSPYAEAGRLAHAIGEYKLPPNRG